MSVHHGQGRRLFPLSMQEWLLLLSSSILFSLDQATPFLPAFVGPCSPDFFSLGFLHGFPMFWSAVLKLSCQLATAEQCERIISATAASVPLCTLQRGVHLFLWQGITARDDILGLRIKMLSWRTLSLSSFSFSVCTVDYFCLRIVLGTCPCEFCSFQTIFWYVRTIWILILFPCIFEGFLHLDIVWKHMSIVLVCPSGCSCRESE